MAARNAVPSLRNSPVDQGLGEAVQRPSVSPAMRAASSGGLASRPAKAPRWQAGLDPTGCASARSVNLQVPKQPVSSHVLSPLVTFAVSYQAPPSSSSFWPTTSSRPLIPANSYPCWHAGRSASRPRLFGRCPMGCSLRVNGLLFARNVTASYECADTDWCIGNMAARSDFILFQHLVIAPG